MQPPVQDTIINRLNPPKCEPLKPVSACSRMITCDQVASLHFPRNLSNPFINLKIEVVNNCGNKRKLNDSVPDDDYETPAKKACSPKALSPDFGCFMDFCSPPAKEDSAPPCAISKPGLLDKTQAINSEIKETVSSRLHSEHVECRSSTEPGGGKGTFPHSLKIEKLLLNPAFDFDYEVDDILCLNPFGTYTAEGCPDHVESCKGPSSNSFHNKPTPTVTHRQELERGDGQVEEGREELKKERFLNERDVEEDKGYFSMSYIKDLKIGKDPSQSVYPQLPPATSSPLLRIGEAECHPESSSEPSCHNQAALSGHVSFKVSDLCPVLSGPHLKSVDSPVQPLDGDIEEVWNIGPPMFESSLCHSVTVTLNAADEQSRQVSEEAHGGVIEPIQECQAIVGEAETTLESSYETSLPLRVQVKSVVVAPSQLTYSCKPVASILAELSTKSAKPSPEENRGSHSAKYASTTSSQRPVILDREADWEREKRLYVHSVTRHIDERPGADQNVMSELMNLMTHVADQTPDDNGRQWQHPSDLTRRNYQRRFGNMMPTMALHEWQAKNCTTYRRFAKVPKIFQRSEFP